MYARIARFEGADPARVDDMITAERAEIEEGMKTPPPGLEGVKGVWMLVDRKTGTGLGITLFESEEDLRRGDAALNTMNPSVPEASGRRVSVEVYEVVMQLAP